MQHPISIDGEGFDSLETYNNGLDVSITLYSGETINIWIDKSGQTHVQMQASASKPGEAI